MIVNRNSSQTLGRFSGILLNNKQSNGITDTVSSDNPGYLITNSAVYDEVGTINTDITALDGRVTTVEGYLNQGVKTTDSPTFAAVATTTGNIYCPFASANTWYNLLGDILFDGLGKFIKISLNGRQGNNWYPHIGEYMYNQQVSSLGGNYLFSYQISDEDITFIPRFVVYEQAVTTTRRLYLRPDPSSRYNLYSYSNQVLALQYDPAGTGATPNDIDGTWSIVYDTDAVSGGYRTNPPNGKLYCGTIQVMNSNELSSDISRYQEYNVAVTSAGAIAGLSGAQIIRMNDLVKCYLTEEHAVSTSVTTINVTFSDTSSYAHISDPQYCSIKLYNETDYPVVGLAEISNTGIKIYADYALSNMTSGVETGFKTCILEWIDK